MDVCSQGGASSPLHPGQKAREWGWEGKGAQARLRRTSAVTSCPAQHQALHGVVLSDNHLQNRECWGGGSTPPKGVDRQRRREDGRQHGRWTLPPWVTRQSWPHSTVHAHAPGSTSYAAAHGRRGPPGGRQVRHVGDCTTGCVPPCCARRGPPGGCPMPWCVPTWHVGPPSSGGAPPKPRAHARAEPSAILNERHMISPGHGTAAQ